MKTSIWVLTALCLTLLLGDIALAAPISFRLSGTLGNGGLPGVWPAEFVAGAPFTTLVTYDLNASDSDASDRRGQYAFASPFGVSITVAGYSLHTVPSFGMTMIVDDGGDIKPSGGVYADVIWISSPIAPADFSIDTSRVHGLGINMSFLNSAGTALSSDALPTTWSLADFNSTDFAFLYTYNGAIAGFGGRVEEISMVPEPSSVMLLGVGGMLLAASFGLARPRRHLF